MDFGIIASKMLRPDVEMIFGESKSGAAHWRPLLAPHPTTLSRFNVATQVRQKGQYWGSYSRGGCSRIFPYRRCELHHSLMPVAHASPSQRRDMRFEYFFDKLQYGLEVTRRNPGT
jgi:hypothetical protein